jgi:peptidyl-prolyl cis-trans isomerase C
LEEIKNRALENLIERELLYQESRRKGIIVEASAVDKQLDAMKSKFPSADVFSKEIGKMNLTEETLKEQLERAIATQRFVEKEIVDTIVVPESAVLDYYKKNKSRMMQPEQIRASHVLIKVDPQKGPEQKKDARKTIEQIEAKVKKGEDFSALAKEYSQCPSSDRGGDLGYFGRGQMVKPFEEAAFALKPGEVSGIVETRFGYHVIKMNEKRPASEMSFEDVKEQLERYLKQEKINEAIGKYVAMLKKDAEIERMLPQDLKAKP